MTGKCLLCGKLRDLTYEHIPPKSAFNQKGIKVQLSEHLLDIESPLFGKHKKAPKGFGGYTLCSSCNNSTGEWYAKDFSDFAQQGMKIIKEAKPQYWIEGNYKVKPLNVLKQMLTMFMSADKGGYLQSQRDLVDFILNKKSQDLPDRFNVYLYSNISPYYRMLGWCFVQDFKISTVTNRWSEINFKPFGYFLTENSPSAHIDQVNISHFKGFAYDEEAEIVLKLPYLRVSSPNIGIYG